MAAKDLTKTKISNELNLLIQRVSKTTELNYDYQDIIYRSLRDAARAMTWAEHEMPIELFLEKFCKHLQEDE